MALRIEVTVREQFLQWKACMRLMRDELIGADGNSGLRAQLAAGPVSWSELVRMVGLLTSGLAAMDQIAAVPGIVEYVREAEGDQAYDVAAEYTANRNAIVAIRDYIVAALPKSADGYLLVQKLTANGGLIDRAFDPGQTTQLRDLISAYAATVG